MAKLESLKMRKDDGERQIKCLIVEDFKTGDVVKYYNSNDFDLIIKETDGMFLTKVYSPTQQEKEELIKSLKDDITVEDGYVSAEITEARTVIGLFKKFTDLEIDLANNDLIEEVVANPNELFIAIKLEMDKILMSTFESYISTYKTLKSNPNAQEALVKSVEIESNIAKENEKQKADEQRIKELKEELLGYGIAV